MGMKELYETATPAQIEVMEAIGLKSAAEGGVLFCACTQESFAINGVTYQWPRGTAAQPTKLRWSLGFTKLGTLSDLDLKGAYEGCCKEIMGACNILLEYTPNPQSANIMVNLANMDGPSGVLADMQIPVSQSLANQLQGRFDQTDSWDIAEAPAGNRIDFYRVALHELLHAMGLGHATVVREDPALIESTYNRSIRHLQPRDVAELQRRYDAAVSPPAGTPAPGPTTCKVDIKITTSDGKSVSFSGTKPLVG